MNVAHRKLYGEMSEKELEKSNKREVKSSHRERWEDFLLSKGWVGCIVDTSAGDGDSA